MEGRKHCFESRIWKGFRYAVVYRLVFKVWVMAVTTMHTNVFVPVRLVETATKGLIATCQVSEVDKDVVSRNYPEVSETFFSKGTFGLGVLYDGRCFEISRFGFTKGSKRSSGRYFYVYC